MKKHRSIQRTVYPISYDKNGNANQATFTKNFNNWHVWLKGENFANSLISLPK